MLKDLVEQCGTKEPPGVEIQIAYTCSCEVTAFPATTGIDPDGDVRLAAAFDFSGAESGEGYWRTATAVVDKSGFNMGMEGEVGAEALFAGAAFYIKGTNSSRAQFALDMVNASGCLLFALKPRKGADYAIIGSKAVPAFVESVDFNSGQKVGDTNGSAYAIRANTNVYYYDEGLGLDLVPNP